MNRLRCLTTCAALLGACGPEPGTNSSTTSETGDAGSSATTPITGDASSTTITPTTGEAVACEPDGGPVPEASFAARFAEAVCAQKAACACEVAPDCVESFTAQFAAVQQFAADNGLHYDEKCAGDTLVDAIEARGCALASDFHGSFMCTPRVEIGCDVYRGDVPTGGECPNYPPDVSAYCDGCADEDDYCHFSDTVFCGPELDRPVVGPGEACISPDNNVIADCGDGSECNPFTRVCDFPAAEGEACDGPFAIQCAGLLWCDAQQTCRAPRPQGEVCEDSVECESGTCEDGVCTDFVTICRVDEPSDLLYVFTL